MIGTVTLNPSVDVKYILDKLELGGVFRCSSPEKTPGGKGLNVSRVLKILGNKVSASGFLGGKNGEWIEDRLEELNIKNKFQNINGETRNCLNIVSENQTEVLELGPEIERFEEEYFLKNYKSFIEELSVVCASGSLPKGLNGDFYRKLGEISFDKGVKFLLDTSKASLLEGIKGKPYLVKPNIDELSDIFGVELKTQEEVIRCGRELLKKGASNVIISLGGEGAILLTEEDIYKGSIPRIKPINTVGSGDSMIAGFAHGISKGYSLEKAFKFSLACGTSNAMQNETGKVDEKQIEKLLREITITKL